MAESKSPMKRSQPKRDWAAARRKVEGEGECRFCHSWDDALEAAHIVGRKHDKPKYNPAKGVYLKTLWVNPVRIVPLCPDCHRHYDPHMRGLNERPLDLLPCLTLAERLTAFEDCGGDALKFLKRVCGVGFVPEEAA